MWHIELDTAKIIHNENFHYLVTEIGSSAFFWHALFETYVLWSLRKWVTWHWWLTTFFVRIRSFFIGVKEVLFINVLKMIYLCIFQWLFFGQLSPFSKRSFFNKNLHQSNMFFVQYIHVCVPYSFCHVYVIQDQFPSLFI